MKLWKTKKYEALVINLASTINSVFFSGKPRTSTSKRNKLTQLVNYSLALYGEKLFHMQVYIESASFNPQEQWI